MSAGEVISPGSLKLLTAWSPERGLDEVVEAALAGRVRPEDVRRLWAGAFLLYTDAAPSELRDRLAARLRPGEGVFVVAFEQWSGRGPGAEQRAWLLRRGH